MHKVARNRPLTDRQRRANKLISKKLHIVEQCFGTMKRLFGMARARYLGTEKVNAQMPLKELSMNLLKAATTRSHLEKHPNIATLRPVTGR